MFLHWVPRPQEDTVDYLNSTLPRFKQAGGLCQITIIMQQGQCPSMFAAASMNCNYGTTLRQILLITIYIMPRTMGIGHWHIVISIHVNFHTFPYVFSPVFLRYLWGVDLPRCFWKGVRTIYTKLMSIHHFKALNKGCILYTRNYGSRSVISCNENEWVMYSSRNIAYPSERLWRPRSVVLGQVTEILNVLSLQRWGKRCHLSWNIHKW